MNTFTNIKAGKVAKVAKHWQTRSHTAFYSSKRRPRIGHAFGRKKLIKAIPE